MQALSTGFLLAALAVTLIVVYLVVLILRRWYFNLSPKETATFALVMFLMGFIVSSYLLSSVIYILAGSLVIFALFGWFVFRTLRRHAAHRAMGRSGVGVSQNAK